MEFLLKRHERLAGYLRDQIRAGVVTEPLPSSREWAKVLGVSCPTLYRALEVLEKEKLLAVRPRRGISLAPQTFAMLEGATLKTVRLIYQAKFSYFPTKDPWVVLLGECLQSRGIQFRVEGLTDARLERLCRLTEPCSPGSRELFLLLSLPSRYQWLFWRTRRPAIILGAPASGLAAPHVYGDYNGAMRHAVNRLFRRGFGRIFFLTGNGRAPGHYRNCRSFRLACASWPGAAGCGEIVRFPTKSKDQLVQVRHFSARVKGRCGIILATPISLSAVMTCLYDRGVVVRDQVEIITIDLDPDSTLVSPMPVQYLVPDTVFARVVSPIAVRFFETGILPQIRKALPMEIIDPNPC